MNTFDYTLARGVTAPGRFAERFHGLVTRLGAFPLSLVELGLRAGVGAVFFKSGLTKVASWDLTVQLFAEEYRVPLLSPEVAAYLATAAELTCPVLLLLGLGARFGALALLGMTAVIQFTVYPENWAEHLLWASVFVYVLTRGAGTLSLDHLISRALSPAYDRKG